MRRQGFFFEREKRSASGKRLLWYVFSKACGGTTIIVKQVYNPYLPSFEYVPDGEPHLFWSEKDKEERVYVYGSHDAFWAPIFCVNDYVCWSAPVSDLTSWRYEGVIFSKEARPHESFGYSKPLCPGLRAGEGWEVLPLLLKSRELLAH